MEEIYIGQILKNFSCEIKIAHNLYKEFYVKKLLVQTGIKLYISKPPFCH